MDVMEFMQKAEKDAETKTLLQEIAVDFPADEDEEPLRMADPLSVSAVALGFAAFVLFRWAQDTLNNDRDNRETDLVARRARLIADLHNKDGIPLDKATKIVDAMLDKVANRRKDDPILTKILNWVGLGNTNKPAAEK